MLEQILQLIPDKMEHKSTTTRKFKADLATCFSAESWRDAIAIEIGTSQGYSTLFMSYLFKEVYTLEIDDWNISEAKKHCDGRDNIKFIKGDAYKSRWTKLFPIVPVPVIFIDCDHNYIGVQSDIANALSILQPGGFIIFDDYGNPRTPGVRQAIDEAMRFGWLKETIKIGQPRGTQIIKNADWKLVDYEGIICEVIQ